MKWGLGGWLTALAFAASVSLPAATSTANAQPAPRRNFQFQTVALSEWAAPGTEPGVTYGPTFFAPLLADRQVLFFAPTLSGAGVDNTNNLGLFAGPAEAVRLAARNGAQAPDTPPGVRYQGIEAPRVNPAGSVAFGSQLAGPGVVIGENLRGIWTGPVGAPRLVAREGEAAPGTPDGVRYVVLQSGLRDLNDRGDVAFSGQLTGAGVDSSNDSGLWAGPRGAVQLVAREGERAPGTGGNVSYGSFQFGVITVNNSGQTVFENGLTNGVNASNNHAIFYGPPGDVRLAVRLGQQAAGLPAGARYESARTPTINDAGHIAFTGVAGGNSAIWAGAPDALQLVAYGGTQAPGAPEGVTYYLMGPALLSSSGGIAFTSGLRGPGTGDNDAGLFAGTAGSVSLVARTGDAAPGTEPGVRFDDPENFAINGAGQVVFQSPLTGQGLTDANDRGIWAFDPAAGLALVVREGEPFDVGGGELRTIRELQFVGREGLTDAGRFGFAATFTDGSAGVFVTVVPEPAPVAIAVVAAGAVAFLRRRRAAE